MPGLDDLIGTTFGSFPVPVTGERVAEFVSATGDDPDQWSGIAPPMFANAALFGAAPAFLEAGDVVPFTRSLIHSEQTFVWKRPLAVGETLSVSGTVEAVRGRGTLNLVTFSLEAGSDAGPWLEGSSIFLMSESAAATAAEATEPAAKERPPVDPSGGRLTLPGSGEAIVEVRCGASRADLVRYAAASGDWNPIHWDHDSARDAGLDGVIVHGLLMAAWLGRVAGRYGSPKSMRTRFRSPLRPAVPALITGSVRDADGGAAELDLVLTAGEQRLVTARASVTR
ncbi:MAG: MaoC family dehydratase N-terminal domain-containing protein [Acidimicrobiia bacterium]